MNKLSLIIDLKFDGEVTDKEWIMNEVEEAIRSHINSRGIVSDKDEAYTTDVIVSEEVRF